MMACDYDGTLVNSGAERLDFSILWLLASWQLAIAHEWYKHQMGA
jgi:hydroxymethylpyrimidine pyrophosphatase-like HAD family hydrolase